MTENAAEIPAKPKRGRPRKSDSPAALQAKIAELEAQLANRSPILQPTPASNPDLPPGSYVEVGIDTNGKTVLAKVRWTRADVESKYPAVTFEPRRSMLVQPHGVPYQLVADTEITVPKIVKDIYMDVLRVEKEQETRYPALTATEAMEIDARAAAEPGSKQWSRVVRYAGGLAIAETDTPGAEPVRVA